MSARFVDRYLPNITMNNFPAGDCGSELWGIRLASRSRHRSLYEDMHVSPKRTGHEVSESAHKHTSRQVDKQTSRQADKQTSRQADKQSRVSAFDDVFANMQ
jgi:hypothetical protein